MVHDGYMRRILEATAILSLTDVVFVAVRILMTGSTRYWFVPANLALAWVSPLLAIWLVGELKNRRWLSWPNLVLTGLWLVFLPNTWYVLTDFIHVYPNGEISQLYDIVLMSLLAFCGFILGFVSLYSLHRQLLRRLDPLRSYWLIQTVILLCSFAIYVGRDLRWNSWDVIANPGGLVLNISDQIADPLGNPRALNVTLLFFVLLSVMYYCIWMVWKPPTPKH
ncbi:MAG TPA: DUF1361 domain-containing protein [Candidatus Saccharimonadales bacterium]|nr:DUF1361 domain-containing protein [Candidatus Saccharimonadales bacterium]